uniref:Uncharacterized protein n=1 Tax=Arundo donax TaxID=35708 RepID=A0A0A9BRV9_ARUDO
MRGHMRVRAKAATTKARMEAVVVLSILRPGPVDIPQKLIPAPIRNAEVVKTTKFRPRSEHSNIFEIVYKFYIK